MMMIHKHHNQRVEVPDPIYEDGIFSPQTKEYMSALKRYLPSSEMDETEWSSDGFRMYEFKVRKCGRGRTHDWTECPYAHPGEKARRRDPRKYHYSGTACPEYRRGSCRKGDSCEYAHGVFECWLHPARYRTQPCKDGPFCTRRVCFFAHSPQQLRVLPESPPLSPCELATVMRGLQVGKVGPRNVWGPSPRSLPSTPTCSVFDPWDVVVYDEEVPMERVESGKDLRAKIYAKLSQDNSFDDSLCSVPDFDWISDLLK